MMMAFLCASASRDCILCSFFVLSFFSCETCLVCLASSCFLLQREREREIGPHPLQTTPTHLHRPHPLPQQTHREASALIWLRSLTLAFFISRRSAFSLLSSFSFWAWEWKQPKTQDPDQMMLRHPYTPSLKRTTQWPFCRFACMLCRPCVRTRAQSNVLDSGTPPIQNPRPATVTKESYIYSVFV